MKTPSFSLLKQTKSSLGHRVAKVAHSPAFQYNSDDSEMQANPAKCTPIHNHNQQNCVDNNANYDLMAMDSPLKQGPPLDPFRNVCMGNGQRNHSTLNDQLLAFDNKEATAQQRKTYSHHSPIKQPLDQSPFPTPLQRHQSEPIVGNKSPANFRSHVLDPVASTLLGQEEVFVSLSSSQHTSAGFEQFPSEREVSKDYQHSNSLPNNINRTSSSPNSPKPLFSKVSGSLHDVKSEDDLHLLARPIPRKLT